MNQRNTILWSAAMGILAVMIGAFGAHAFKPALTAMGRLETYELAVRYQFYHALAMLAVGILADKFPSKYLKYAAYSFLLGIFFILGWGFLFGGVYKK